MVKQLMIPGALSAPSGGSGGPLTDAKEVWFESSNGYGSYYHRYVAHVDWSKPVGIMFWFHGDGGYEFENPDDPYYLAGPNGVVAKARAANSVLIVPGTPDDGASRGGTWWKWGTKDSNPRYAKELFVHITSQYNVDLYRVWLCGFSGGAEFLTLYLLRYWGNEMGIKGGGCLMIGGGTKPPVDADFPADYKGHWVWEWRVGALDTGKNADGTTAGDGFNAVAASQGGEQWFRERGWKTALDIVPGKGHLMPRFYGELVQRSLDNNPPPAGGLSKPKDVYYGGLKIKEAWFNGRRVYSAKPVEVMPRTPGKWEAQDWLRGKLEEYGENYATVTELPFNIDSSGTVGMYAMFNGFAALKVVPQLDTRNVTTMNTMFQGCESLTTVPELDTRNVTDMHYMFFNCPSLTAAPQMDTRNVTDMSYMFNKCSSLSKVPQMDTSRVTSMRTMFQRCESLTTVPQMDTRNVTEMGYMFASCFALETVPQMNTGMVTNFTETFFNCSSLTDGNVALTMKRKGADTTRMIAESGLTREPFLTIE